jgi:hypothetical protein
MPPDEVAQATALMMFANYFKSSLFVSFGKTVFINRLVPALQEFSPLLNAQDLINAGTTGVRLAVSEEDLPGVLLAFNQALTQTFVSEPRMDVLQKLTRQYLAAGTSAIAFFTSWGLGWRSVKKKKTLKLEEWGFEIWGEKLARRFPGDCFPVRTAFNRLTAI